jgi:hypothetical protein
MTRTTRTQRTARLDRQAAPPPTPIQAPDEPFVTRWHVLVSDTNWEKGRIIVEWKAAQLAAGRTASDDAWSRLVGGVSPQHVGRLRRVYERFCEQRALFAGLYWTHFLAALDWADAEMWLEGAVHSGWSVMDMRRQRWEALGAPPELRPREEDIVAAELDEDALPPRRAGEFEAAAPQPAGEPHSGPDLNEGPDFGDEAADASPAAAPFEAPGPTAAAALPRVSPFESLPPLPADLADAFEQLKLAVLRHKLAQWQDVPADHVLAALDALKVLVLAPSGA